MSAEFLAPLAPIAEPAMHASANAVANMAASTPGTPDRSFGHLVSQGLEQVNAQMAASQTDLQNLAVGEVQNLHQVMIRLEESRLSFHLMLQVRNRLLESYQELMRMQV